MAYCWPIFFTLSIKRSSREPIARRATICLTQVPAGITLADEYSVQKEISLADIVTHVRQVGAWEQADYIDHTLARQYHYRYKQFQNPYLLSREECLAEAERMVNTSVEQSIRRSFDGPFLPVLEREDIVSFDGESWIVDSISAQMRLKIILIATFFTRLLDRVTCLSRKYLLSHFPSLEH